MKYHVRSIASELAKRIALFLDSALPRARSVTTPRRRPASFACRLNAVTWHVRVGNTGDACARKRTPLRAKSISVSSHEYYAGVNAGEEEKGRGSEVSPSRFSVWVD